MAARDGGVSWWPTMATLLVALAIPASEAFYGPQCRLRSESGCSGSQRYFDPTASAVTFWPAAWTGGASDAPNAALTAGDLVGGDGLADVLVGGYDGGVVLFVNAGSSDAPAFVETPWDYGAVNASSSASPWLADIFDDDGLLDLVVGERLSGTVRLYKNGGTAAAPDFSGGPTAIPAPRRDQPAGVREHGSNLPHTGTPMLSALGATTSYQVCVCLVI